MPSPTKAQAKDVPSIVTLFTTTFNSPFFQNLFPPTDTGYTYLSSAWGRFVKDERVLVIKDDAGIVKAAVLYFALEGGTTPWTQRWPEILEGMNELAVAEFFESMDEQHGEAMQTESHIYLELILTHPDARRQGYATALIKEVLRVADGIGRKTYLDAQSHAIGLYKNFGFQVHGVKDTDDSGEGDMTPMIRDPQPHQKQA